MKRRRLPSLAALNDLPVLPDVLIGVGAGAATAKLLIWRLERRSGDLPARRARQIEAIWIGACAIFAALISTGAEVL